ncbi:MAG: nucleotidyl transferase AbiEii/AbiGii toxin family protein [candidate division KSB1 bacterium]|nr:nucleotidyl transferase AbiEii/AbiGii toxin family protein [candidate division KSB1 bacterium]MDZ7368304.1 nucleotidyl transferase AbiEii/AbiGii toxin family protein [candidate division KSB1 bacterium]MDZ7406116.1 nucleotidyl transferase AbiEii/AbiGii toxin family protein [candidate division KSB1 bacterium]
MSWQLLKQKAADEQIPFATLVFAALHLPILEGLFNCPESHVLNFQGGTSIHLLHGGYRYSEDLHFAGNELNWAAAEKLVRQAQADVEKMVTQLLGVGEHQWKLPDSRRARRIYVAWYMFLPQGQRQKFRIKIEFAHSPVYRPQPFAVRSELDVIQRLPLVNGLTPAELLAEKIAAVLGRPCSKGCDLFGLWYLHEVLHTAIDAALLQKKIHDYHVVATAETMHQKLDNFSPALLISEMSRFLPVRYRRMVEKNGYDIIRASASRVLDEARCALDLISN